MGELAIQTLGAAVATVLSLRKVPPPLPLVIALATPSAP